LYPAQAGKARDLGSIVDSNTNPYSNLPTFTNAAWYGAADGKSAIQNMLFNGMDTYSATLLVRETGNSLVFGWYELDSGGAITGGGVLVDGNTVARADGGAVSVQFTPTTGTFGFFVKYGTAAGCAGAGYLSACNGGLPADIYYTESARNSSSTQPTSGAGATMYETDYDRAPRQHFAAISTLEGLVLGVEDSWSIDSAINTLPTPLGPIYERGGDYQDLVLLIHQQAEPMPEPSTLGLMGAGLLGCVLWMRRRT
jgi:hypothetical protein